MLRQVSFGLCTHPNENKMDFPGLPALVDLGALRSFPDLKEGGVASVLFDQEDKNAKAYPFGWPRPGVHCGRLEDTGT